MIKVYKNGKLFKTFESHTLKKIQDQYEVCRLLNVPNIGLKALDDLGYILKGY